jgi:hypothetical protein
VLITVIISGGAWWPLLNIIKATHNPYLLGLLKIIFYLDNFAMLLSFYSFRALALGAKPEDKELVKLALWILIIFIVIELPIIISQL